MQRNYRKSRQHAKSTMQAPSSATFHITALTHDGRGIATYGKEHAQSDQYGKKAFIDFALPNETVKATINKSKKSFDEGWATHIITASKDRQSPVCQHFGVCGGCSLQHLDTHQQILHKQSILANHLRHHAGAEPSHWLPPVLGDCTGYRTKARLGVRHLKNGTLIMGFRERASNFLTNIDDCPILDCRINQHLQELKDTLITLDGKDSITHLEFATGDASSKVAMVVRHIKPLGKQDLGILTEFCQQIDWQLYLQPKGADSTHRIDGADLPRSQTTPPTGGLFYELPDFNVMLECSPLDFTQINLSINRQMIALACQLLDLQQGECVLDLFCGLGNFSLPMARCVGDSGRIVGVEGSQQMVERATMNAVANGIHHATFYTHDLTQDFSNKPWVGHVDALLIDPPRAGAIDVVRYLGKFNAKRLVYISCDPATLARDSAVIIAQGYRLTHAGVMDMFCHTSHVESIARFEKI
ncbi:23S rRNA (uracil(1939)-C(5))-methyltransferase RlmD [Moraxella sp. Tifton1]|uniref:23S rRNA (uracil(1939)-C(5))-methyltransferase RlmD n=1 Tax=Moraxella oculi TaxID=2940516 RepID=A0ABW8U6Z2_9GAMM|nr:23S rRNA (uracil(1939)-C(5))-methyltransferase RlmD [Moraxella sp. Tifton1]MCL1623493.1 23S rRNA (uracil(1939)-C(5))-methyltransferase RlmD [Moraxella sp. Tifton1]